MAGRISSQEKSDSELQNTEDELEVSCAFEGLDEQFSNVGFGEEVLGVDDVVFDWLRLNLCFIPVLNRLQFAASVMFGYELK